MGVEVSRSRLSEAGTGVVKKTDTAMAMPDLKLLVERATKDEFEEDSYRNLYSGLLRANSIFSRSALSLMSR